MSAAAFRALAMALGDVAFQRSERASDDGLTDRTRQEALSQALLFNGFARALVAAASAIEAATAGETRSGSTEGESATRQGDAQEGVSGND